MNRQFIEDFISPDDPSQSLLLNQEQGVLTTKDGLYSYPIVKDVPILLKNKAFEVKEDTPFHKNNGSEFQYIDHYEKDAAEYDYFGEYAGENAHEQRRLQETIIRQVPHSAKKILDVGCGRAWVASHFTPKNVQVCSMDISSINTAKALEKVPSEHHSAVVADAFSLPFKTGTFDCIIASEVIEHVPDPQRFITSLLKILSKGGSLIISTPYKETIQYSLCVHCNCPTPHHAHLHSFDKPKLEGYTNETPKSEVRTFTFANKALIKLRTNVLLKYFPYGIWKLIDGFWNIIIRKPSRVILMVKK